MAAPVVTDIVVTPPLAPASPVNWGAIIAGALVAATATFILMLVGSGLGLTMVSPWSGSGVSATTFLASSAVGLIVVQWLSSALGGYVAGRLRTRWVAAHTDEVFFRDTAHGLLAWALATLLVVGVLGSAIGSAIGIGANALSSTVGSAAGTAAAGAATAAANNSSQDNLYFVDLLMRPAPAPANGASPATAAPQAGEEQRTAQEISRILLTGATGEISADDKAYLAQLVAQRTGLPQADAQKRVDEVIGKINEAKLQAKKAADTARKASATAALVGALALVIGAFIAAAAAAFGGHLRDEQEDRLAA